MRLQDFIKANICEYPILYATVDEHASIMRLLDHTFNTIGNGYNTIEDLELTFNELNKINIDNYDKYVSKQLYYGYKVCDKFGFPPSYSDKENEVVATEEERINYPNITKWRYININYLDECYFYPNFEKEYSMVWRIPEFFNLGEDWIKAAIMFYEECLIFSMGIKT